MQSGCPRHWLYTRSVPRGHEAFEPPGRSSDGRRAGAQILRPGGTGPRIKRDGPGARSAASFRGPGSASGAIRPPWASTIDDRWRAPSRARSGLVVKKGSKSRWRACVVQARARGPRRRRGLARRRRARSEPRSAASSGSRRSIASAPFIRRLTSDLLELHGVAPDRREALGEDRRHLDPASRQLGPEQGHHRLHHRPQRRSAGARWASLEEPADPGDDRARPVRVLDDVLQRRSDLGQVRVLPGQQLFGGPGVADDGEERLVHLVGDGGHHLAHGIHPGGVRELLPEPDLLVRRLLPGEGVGQDLADQAEGADQRGATSGPRGGRKRTRSRRGSEFPTLKGMVSCERSPARVQYSRSAAGLRWKVVRKPVEAQDLALAEPVRVPGEDRSQVAPDEPGSRVAGMAVGDLDALLRPPTARPGCSGRCPAPRTSELERPVDLAVHLLRRERHEPRRELGELLLEEVRLLEGNQGERHSRSPTADETNVV